MAADRLTLRIDAPHFTAGVLLDAVTQFAVHAAPIVSYMKGWSRASIEAYCAARRWKCECAT